MSVTLGDIEIQTNDYIRNYTTGSIDLGNRDRAINRAIEYFQRRFGFPSDERIFTFLFTQDQLYYDLPIGFNEPLQLLYHNQNNNIPPLNEFNYSIYPEILRIGGITPNRRFFGTTTINRKNQLVVFAQNLFDGAIIDTFDQPISEGWIGQDDATALEVDTNQKVEGSASLRFDIDTALSGLARASLYRSGLNFDFTTYHEQNGIFKIWTYLTATDFTSIDFNFGTDALNYYKITASVQDDSTPFVINDWNKIGWSFNNAIMVGSPDDTNITFFRIDFNEDVGFVSVPNMRVDDLFSVIPDELDLIFYSNFKGTDVSGSTEKLNLDSPDDITYFGNFTPDLIGPVSQRAALNLIPQLRQDPTWYQGYRADMDEQIKTLSRTFPRKRITTMRRTRLARLG